MKAVHRQLAQQRVRHGGPFLAALESEIATSGDTRFLLVCSPRQALTDEVSTLRAMLGERLVGSFEGVLPHVPLDCVVEGAARARKSEPDCLIAMGGGSVIDAAKAILACLDAGVEDEAGLRALLHTPPRVDPSAWDAVSATRIVAIPTTLSAAECSWFGGVTDVAEGTKRAVAGVSLVPRTIIYDPALTVRVPLPTLLASGIKAVDHAAERLGSLVGHPYSDALSEKALSLLAAGLPRVKADPADLEAHHLCQMGAWLSMAGAQAGVPVGASHALGHVIGGATGALHGFTSCVSLAPVLRWNLACNGARQEAIARGLGSTGGAADAVEALVRALSLPTRLRDISVSRDAIPNIAFRALRDPPMRSNPRQPVDVAEIERLVVSMW